MIDMGVLFDKPKNPGDIDSIRISIASPEQIKDWSYGCLLYTSPSPRDLSTSRMPSSA